MQKIKPTNTKKTFVQDKASELEILKEKILSKKIEEKTTPSQRRTDRAIEAQNIDPLQTIDQLKDNRGFFRNFMGSICSYIPYIDGLELSYNIKDVIKLFEQYKKYGITIPRDILNNFEKGIYVTETQAAELKQLTAIAEQASKRKDFGPFNNREIVVHIIEQGLLQPTPKERLHFLSSNMTLRSLLDKPAEDRLRVVLTGTDIGDPKNPKFEYAKNNNFKLKIELKCISEIQNMIDFMKDPDNANLLTNLEVFNFDFPLETQMHAANWNIEQHWDLERCAQELLNLLESKCPNLISFSCQDIDINMELPMTNLISLSCGPIGRYCSLTFPYKMNNLIFLSFGDLGAQATIELPSELKNLKYLYFGSLYTGATLKLPSKMESLEHLSFVTLARGCNLTLPSKMDNLQHLSFENIHSNISVIFPLELNNLKYLSFKLLCEDVTVQMPSKMENLEDLSLGNICKGITFKLPSELNNLTRLSCLSIMKGAIFTMPEVLPNLIKISYRITAIDDPKLKKIFENLKANLPSNKSKTLSLAATV